MFDFRTGRGREGPKKFLGNYQGILQTDGYAAYEDTGGAGMVHAARWAHARRKLFNAVKLSPEDRTATQLVARVTTFSLWTRKLGIPAWTLPYAMPCGRCLRSHQQPVRHRCLTAINAVNRPATISASASQHFAM